MTQDKCQQCGNIAEIGIHTIKEADVVSRSYCEECYNKIVRYEHSDKPIKSKDSEAVSDIDLDKIPDFLRKKLGL